MKTWQEPKYMIVDENGEELPNARLANRKTGDMIPDIEPVMVFRAKDRQTTQIQFLYADMCKNPGHKRAVMMRREHFLKFQDDCPEQVKEPD